MDKRKQLTVGLAFSIGLLSACGGSSSDPVATETANSDAPVETAVSDSTAPTEPPVTEPPATDPPVTEPAVTEPPVTEPPVTEPPVTDPPEADPSEGQLPEWASGEMVTVQTDTGARELPVELAPFCESSRSFYTAANGLDFLADGQVATLQQLFAAMAAIVPVTIETAPSEEFTVEPRAALEQLAVLVPAFEAVEFDGSRLAESPDADAVLTALQGFQETRLSLREFLVQACGADEAVLDEQAREAVAIAAESVGETIAPSEPVEAVPGTPINNDGSTILLETPVDWTQIEELGGDYPQLVAAPDTAAFFALEGPGVLVLRGEGGFRDGGFVGRVLTFQSDLEEAGCTQVDELSYDDGVYNGQERVFECAVEGLDVRILGGTEADESLYAMVLLIHPSDQLGIRELIVATFEVA